MARIETFQDILDALDNHPEWVQALRERLLTPELLALPEQFAAFSQMVNARLESLENSMAEVKADVAELKTDVAELKTDVGELKGHTTPMATQRMLGTITQTANVRRPRWLANTDIIDIADDAQDEGRADIPGNEMLSFRNMDLALTAIDKTTGEDCYLIIECSYTLEQNDVVRAQRNAQHMTSFTGRPAKPIVTANSVPEPVRQFAEEQGVTCIQITTKAAAPR